MDYRSKLSKDEIKSFLHTYNTCEECKLHKFRKTLITGKGCATAQAVILLDRVSVQAAQTGDIMAGGEGKVLQHVLRFVSEYYPVIKSKFFWVTPVVICPTQSLGRSKAEMLPAPATKEQSACSSRLFGEIHRIQPEIIIACGSAAFKALKPEQGSYEGSLGRVIEGHIDGDSGSYPIPTMITYSMNQLFRDPTQNVGGMWNKTISHFKLAVEIAQTLTDLRSDTHE